MTRRRQAGACALLVAGLIGSAAPAAQAAGPELHVSILVDRMTVLPGAVVHYEVRVENTGDAEAGPIRVTSHYPEGTSAAEQRCPQGFLEPDGDLCLSADIPTPGLGEGAHQVNHSRGGLAPGEAFSLTFAVQVDPDTPLGTHLRTHAHASAATAPEVSSAPVDTLVVDAVPHAVFGAAGVQISGQVVSDSWDSSVGPLTTTRQPTGGDVASNSSITVSGGSLVQGDATPGPAGTVTVTDTARVTGSTAPAPALVVLNEVDAALYGVLNDNHRICRPTSSCSNTIYDSATRTLVVNESAVLPTGAYYLCRLVVKGDLTVAGKATIWFGTPEACGGRLDPVLLESDASLATVSGSPRDLQLRVQGPGTVRIASDSSFTGVVYAPGCALNMEGHGTLLGSATAGAASFSGSTSVHVDRALG